jgi:poly-gamma-glutamate synthesis protein (capsule biosynthesis protein)
MTRHIKAIFLLFVLFSCASPPPTQRDSGIETPSSEIPGTEIPRPETPETETPRAEIPLADTPQAAVPQTEAQPEIPQVETPQIPLAVVPQTETPRPQAPQTVIPRVEIPRALAEDYVTIIAVGDNLYHDVMIREGENGEYAAAYSELRSLISKADIAFINQETLLAGAEYGFTGYPQFNSPQKLGRAIAALGFNVVNHATNHIMDKGEKAVFATMDFWDTFPEVRVLGIHRSGEARARPVIIEKNNIKLGFLSYTYGTNGLPVPRDKPYLVSLINRNIMEAEINAIRPLCDVLVVSMHWGEEYIHDPGREQKNLAVFLAERGVDLVIGHHPHVIQPVEYIPRPDGKQMLCFYSLGNLLSAQTGLSSMLGAMAYVKIKRTYGNESAVIFADAGAIPLVTHYERNFTGFKTYPLYAYSEELAGRHRIKQAENRYSLEYLSNLSARIFGSREIRNNPFGP